MTDIVLRDVDPALRARIEAVARRHGWDLPDALAQLLEAGLRASEAPGAAPVQFAGRERDALAGAIAALEQVPDDPGFALIGRVDPAQPAG